MSCAVGVGCSGRRLCTRRCWHSHAGRHGTGGVVMSRRSRLIWDAEANRTMSIVAVTLACLVLTVTWASVGYGVLFSEEPISVRGLVASVAFAMAGIGAGVLVGIVGAGYARRRGRAVPAQGSENMALFQLLMGLTLVGWGMDSALQATPTGWASFSLLSFSGIGGFSIGTGHALGGRAKIEGVSEEVLGHYGQGIRR